MMSAAYRTPVIFMPVWVPVELNLPAYLENDIKIQ